jgi:hypothetical protein
LFICDAGSVLVHPHDRGIDHLHHRVVTCDQSIHDPVPDAGLSGACDIEVEQYSLPEGFSSERSIWYADISADFKTYMEGAFDSDKLQ